jgi:gamma-glutamyltranspeptidase/glutathione hydrolase
VSSDKPSSSDRAGVGISAFRPTLMGTRHMVVAGHYLAAETGFTILEAGGNAVDAGVAAGIALGILQSDLVNIAGVAPIILYIAESREVLTISGLGTWPAAASVELFEREHGGHIPVGLLRTVVPAAPDAWILALEKYGTMTFAEVAAAAIRFASEGFPMHPLMAGLIAGNEEAYRRWPASAEIYLPNGRPPNVGERFVQADLARSLQYMVDEEAATKGDRAAGLKAARDAFYCGDIAATIVDYHAKNGGLLTATDMAGYRSAIEPPVQVNFADVDVYTCGPWCQGPVLAQSMALLKGMDVEAMGHNSPDYIHTITEALKLAYADREGHYGDPRFVDVPLTELLSPAYNKERRKLIRADVAWPEMPPVGDPGGRGSSGSGWNLRDADGEQAMDLDTSYISVVDRHGNVFSATPSDISSDTPVIPGTGLCPSSRGSQSWVVAGHPSAVAPGKRPRLTPNPAFAMAEGKFVMPFGTPGGDAQPQAMLQVFLNCNVFGMEMQESVEAPRFITSSFPGSFEPHDYFPGRLNLESRISGDTADALAAKGHTIEWWPDWMLRTGSVCAIKADLETGILAAGADPRRPCYAVGW